MKKFKLGLLTLGVLTLASCNLTNANVNPSSSNSTPSSSESSQSSSSSSSSSTTEATYELDLSSKDYNLEKEFFYDDYNTRSLADETRQGIKTFETKDDIVFDAVTYEELVSIFESEGNYLILFGGSWCHNTRAAVPFINQFANEYDIDTVYNFDFYVDGTNSSSHVRNTNQTDPTRVTPGVEYNYLYGELATRYLTNLNDYVEYTQGSTSSLTYTNNENAEVNVPKLQVPFLFLYNKDNTVDNKSGGGTSNAKGTFPIVYGFEEMIDLD